MIFLLWSQLQSKQPIFKKSIGPQGPLGGKDYLVMHVEHKIEPEKLMEVIEEADKVSEQINQREDDCLNRIFTRYCLLKALLVDFSKVKRKKYPGRDNYWEYWYMYGTPQQYFLMSRELTVENTEPKLNITFNRELAHNNEL